MSTSRLADSRIRAAASQVVGLDVRGPVSRALGQIPVPLAKPTDETEPLTSPPSVTSAAKTPRRTGAKAARRVHKPFAEAPWPTQKTQADPKAALSGLTADERRVHRILLDTLAIQNQQTYADGSGVPGLTYAEKQRLAALDLAFINAEIAKMDRRTAFSPKVLNTVMAAGAGTLGITAGGLLLLGEGTAALGIVGIVALVFFLIMPLILLATGNASSGKPVSTPQRKIYAALRELALLVDDVPVSDALQQADAVIDRLAADDGPRLTLDEDIPTSAAAAYRTRTRS